MKTRGNPSGPEAFKTSSPAEYMGATALYDPLTIETKKACKTEESIYGLKRSGNPAAGAGMLGYGGVPPNPLAYISESSREQNGPLKPTPFASTPLSERLNSPLCSYTLQRESQ
jgi:hypothetical protein